MVRPTHVFLLRDINPTRRRPLATYLLIALNIAVFCYQFFVLSGAANEAFVLRHGVVPIYLLSGYGPALSTPFSSMFIHGSLLHLFSNMLFLGVFGDNVEDALGHARFVLFYLVTGLAAVLTHALIDPNSQVPLVGASGAISGVLGAYVVLFPRVRIVTWLVVQFEVSALFYIAMWFGLQVWSALGSLARTAPRIPGMEGAGVAFFAHVGGFVTGVLLLFILGRPRGPATYLGPRIPASRYRRR